MVIDLARFTKAFAERQRNLADMRHLFHRRTDERGQTFPFRLPNDPQSATKIARRVHRPDRSGTRRRFPPADDRARNNARRLRRALRVSRDWFRRHACNRALSRHRHVAPHKPHDRRSSRQIHCRPFPNERPGRNRASSPDRNLVRNLDQFHIEHSQIKHGCTKAASTTNARNEPAHEHSIYLCDIRVHLVAK